MVNIRRALTSDISEAILAAVRAGDLAEFPEHLAVSVKRADDTRHGDYASSVALAAAKLLKMPPMEIAKAIVGYMPEREYIGVAEAVQPGFVNVRIHSNYLASRMDDMLQEDLCAACDIGGHKTVNLEFISANPTGPLTLGNARTAFSADTLGNVMECAGYNVIREYYINDAGAQIARLGQSVLRRILQQQGESVEFPEDLYQGEYIADIASHIAEEYREQYGKEFSLSDLEDAKLLEEISTKAMLACLEAIKKTVREDLHIAFDVWSSERAIRKSGKIEEVLRTLDEKGLLYEKDGAKFLQTTKFGDAEDRVIVKKDGEYAYIAPDVAYHQDKFDREFDMMFTYLGADHQGHAPKLTAALAALGNDTSKLHIVFAQFLSILQGGKQVSLSKRKGNVYGPKDLIGEIGYDVARYFLISHALNSHMALDLDKAKEKSEANPVYYIQYAYVRLQSILRKAKTAGIFPPGEIDAEITSAVTISHESERAFALALFAFPEVIEDIAQTFQIHQLPQFAYEVARSANAFYRDVQVLSEPDEALRLSRLQMVRCGQAVLGKILDLLGIGKPEVM